MVGAVSGWPEAPVDDAGVDLGFPVYRSLAWGRWSIVFLSAHFPFCVDRSAFSSVGRATDLLIREVVGSGAPQGGLCRPVASRLRGQRFLPSHPRVRVLPRVDSVW